MNNVLLLVNTSNIFNSLHRTFGNGKLDYKQYVDAAAGADHIYHALAYGCQIANKSYNFISVLSELGFVCKFKTPYRVKKIGEQTTNIWSSPNVGLTIDACKFLGLGKIDRVMIGSSDPELVDLVSWIRQEGIVCDVFSCHVPKILRDAASSVHEIGESMLLK